jgi:hypothetical protein
MLSNIILTPENPDKQGKPKKKIIIHSLRQTPSPLVMRPPSMLINILH